MSLTFNMVGSGSSQSGPVSVEPLSVSANGTYTAPSGTAYSPVAVNVPSTSAVAEKDVNFLDHDGTLLYSYTAEEANALTSLPTNPTHTGLTSQGWNWTLAEIKSQLVSVGGSVWVGQMYITDDGKTRIYCHFEEGRKSPLISLAVNGSVSVDWGDGSTPDSINGTSTSTLQTAEHAYSSGGDYVISIEVISGEFAINGNSSDQNQAKSYLFKKPTASYSNENNIYLSCVRKVEIGSGAIIGGGAFARCLHLKAVTVPIDANLGAYAFCQCNYLPFLTLPSGDSSISNGLFYYCYSLTRVSVSGATTEIGNSAFGMCYSLQYITVPNSAISIADYAFSNTRLNKIAIPNAVTSLGFGVFSNILTLAEVAMSANSAITQFKSNLFNYCESLVSASIPQNVTSVSTYVFANCFGVRELHCFPTTPPTAESTTFSNFSVDCIFYVPYSADHSVLNAYKAATNWSSYASQMQEESA